ncbi:MAG: trypsin-like peptidase domain-containing protein [Candidatus Woesearchaeota archaeon]
MHKEKKHHLIYGIILAVIVLSFGAYEYYQNMQTEESLIILQNTFESKLTENVKTINENINELKTSLTTTQKDVSGLSTSLIEKETQIKGLSGELAQVKIENQEQLGQLESQITKLKSQNEDFSSIIENSIPAVVSVRTNLGSGSGFLISNDGYIVTNYHVIQGASAAAIVTSDGEQHRVYLIGNNPNADIAVLKIEGDFSYLRFGNSNNINVGEKVIAVGNPGGLDFSVTQGIVSAVNRLDADGNNFVQIDVAINPGNSGGPLINLEGKVIGVNTKKIESFEGVGFAISSNQVEDIVNDLIADYEAAQTTQ